MLTECLRNIASALKINPCFLSIPFILNYLYRLIFNLMKFLEYFHKDYVGWDNDDPMPGTKEEAIKWLQFTSQYHKILIYELKPITIKVYGDFAFAHYYYYTMNEIDYKRTPEMGRWTDILMKQGDKWVMIVDHGGEEK